ncbi:unnamed protein product [Protopolystoma xenopodis]|uniref:Uncharacterized protein n=1 Tax=Protopolystoma xenopodis TaxID=117903 RepID=A0A3S4ZXW1_9PLAT|nr:unnamed protein product [Protopolystoma xenopodis]
MPVRRHRFVNLSHQALSLSPLNLCPNRLFLPFYAPYSTCQPLLSPPPHSPSHVKNSLHMAIHIRDFSHLLFILIFLARFHRSPLAHPQVSMPCRMTTPQNPVRLAHALVVQPLLTPSSHVLTVGYSRLELDLVSNLNPASLHKSIVQRLPQTPMAIPTMLFFDNALRFPPPSASSPSLYSHRGGVPFLIPAAPGPGCKHRCLMAARSHAHRHFFLQKTENYRPTGASPLVYAYLRFPCPTHLS